MKYKRAVLFLLCFIILIQPFQFLPQIKADPIFSDGFESGDVDEWDSSNPQGGSLLEVQNSTKNTDTYALHCTMAAWNNYDNVQKDVTAQSTAYVRFYTFIHVMPASGQRIILSNFIGSTTANNVAGVGIYNDGGTYKWDIYYSANGSQTDALLATPNPTTDNWYCVELKTVVSGTEGEMRVYIDGSDLLDVTSADNNNEGNCRWLQSGINFTGGGTESDVYIDDVVVDTSYIGPLESEDSTPPTYSDLSVSTIIPNASCDFNLTANDDEALSHYIFSTNNTGSWINDTVTAFSTTPETVTVNKTLNSTVMQIVGYRWFLNDTSNNWNDTGIQAFTLSYIFVNNVAATLNPKIAKVLGVNISHIQTVSHQINRSYYEGLHIVGNLVKDGSNTTVILRGVNYARFIDTPNGDWIEENGDIQWDTWNATAAALNLDAMEANGINVVRTLATVEWWTANTDNFKQNIKDWITLAADREIYIVLTFWRVSSTETQANLPYPPYNTGENDTAIISDEAAFADMWGDIASELKDYPNVIFELWNEPGLAGGVDQSIWYSAVQSSIDAIREAGAKNIIVVGWDGFALDYVNWIWGSLWGADWITALPLSDTEGNLLYTLHTYPDGLYNWDNNLTCAVDLSDIEWAYEKLNVTTISATHPIWVGEVGANQWQTYLEDELTAFNNTLIELNSLGIGYAGWDWWVIPGEAFGLLTSGGSNYELSDAGNILVDSIS